MTGNRKALNRWARDFGYADFGTYIRAGGCISEAGADIRRRIASLLAAEKALSDGSTLQTTLTESPAQTGKQYGSADAGIGPGTLPHPEPLDSHAPQALSREESPGQWSSQIFVHPDERPDPDNAHIQGAEHEP